MTAIKAIPAKDDTVADPDRTRLVAMPKFAGVGFRRR
jgi:hypothetical protein